MKTVTNSNATKESELQLFQFILTDGLIVTVPATSYMEAVRIVREEY